MIKKIEYDYSLSFARMIAMVFIISCHFLQFYGNELAWWFNVGVQMFFFISGWIFSKKNMSIKVMVKQFLKILIPYYIVALCTYCIWGGVIQMNLV